MRPGVMTTAKALGGGLPVGACLTSPEAAGVLERRDHGSTFAGGPLIAAAALAVLDIVDDPRLLGRVSDLGSSLRERLGALDGVRQVRGWGLMIGVGLEEGIDAHEIAAAVLDARLVISVPEPGSLRLLPPPLIGEEEVERAAALLADALGQGG